MIAMNSEIFIEKKQGLLFLGSLVILTVIFPFVNLFHLLQPSVIFGKSAWIVIPVVIIGMLYLSLFLSKRSKLLAFDLWILAMIILSWLIISARGVIYSQTSSYLDARYIATGLIFFAFSHHLMKMPLLLRVVAYAVIVQGILVALARSINFYIFPYVMISIDSDGTAFLNLEGDLTRDLLLGSSISANHMVCGMFVLLGLFKHKIIRLNIAIFITIQSFLMLSTFNTGSRYPMTVAMFLFLFSLSSASILSLKNILILIATCLGLFSVVILSNISEFDYFSRYSESVGGRGDKLDVTFILISNSFLDFFIGSSSELILSTIVDGVLISDNSYGLVATSFGVPFMLVFFAYIFFKTRKMVSDRISLFMILYIAIGFSITNCILWEPWVFTAFMSFAVVAHFGGNPHRCLS